MEKKLKFFGKNGKFDDAIHTATDNEPLIIELQVDTGRSVDYYATIQNESGRKVDIKVKDKKFEIPKDIIENGSIDITITAKVKNETVDTFFCEKLIVKYVNGEKQVIPEVQALHIELDKVRQEFISFKKEVSEMIEKQNKCIEALMEG